jgi:hypothetical protein
MRQFRVFTIITKNHGKKHVIVTFDRIGPRIRAFQKIELRLFLPEYKMSSIQWL